MQGTYIQDPVNAQIIYLYIYYTHKSMVKSSWPDPHPKITFYGKGRGAIHKEIENVNLKAKNLITEKAKKNKNKIK